MKRLLTSAFIFFLAFTTQGQDLSLFEKQLYVDGTDTLPCRILTPANFKKGQKYPLLVFLHGAGERGSDNEKQLSGVQGCSWIL